MTESIRIASVTGVDVHMPIAGPGARSYAFIIDWHIRVLIAAAWLLGGMVVYGWGADLFNIEGNTPQPVFTVILPAMAIYTLYHPVLEVVMSGSTPGKRMAGVRIVTVEGHVPGIGALLVRNLLRLVDSLPFFYVLGLLCTMLTAQSVRIGDLAAGTVLVYDRAARDPVTGLSEASVGRLGLQQNELVRELIARWDELDPAARKDLARKLLTRHGQDVAGETADDVLYARLTLLLK